jgi:hypothetical protein
MFLMILVTLLAMFAGATLIDRAAERTLRRARINNRLAEVMRRER